MSTHFTSSMFSVRHRSAVNMTKVGALMLILNDQHEHLGQSIACARSNSVVPPWSK